MLMVTRATTTTPRPNCSPAGGPGAGMHVLRHLGRLHGSMERTATYLVSKSLP